MFPERVQSGAADVMVTIFDRESIAASLQLARDLRATGLSVEVFPEADKLGKQFKYAAARGIRFVTVLGTDERAAGQVTIKNLENSEQAAVGLADASGWLKLRRGVTH
jgi:histidyl-tRNA synthetase